MILLLILIWIAARLIYRWKFEKRSRDPSSHGRAGRDLVGERPVGQRLGEMHAADLLGAVEIGERARDAQHAMIAARREPHRVGGIADQRKPAPCRACATSSSAGPLACALVRTPASAERRIALRLHVARARDARRDLAAALGGRRQDQVGGRHGRHLDVQVDAVEQRAGQPPLIVGGAARRSRRAGR